MTPGGAGTARLRRSALYMPGSNARALQKATSLDVDALILDLEDAVAPEAKALARQQVCEAVQDRRFGGRETVIRINALATPWGAEDLVAAVAARPDAILVPKVERPGDIVEIDRRLDVLGAAVGTRIWAMMETPRAMLGALAIADMARDTRLDTLVLGLNDLARETRAQLAPSRAAMLPWLAVCVAAGRANGLAVLDGVFNRIDDPESFRAECSQAREFGLDGKTLIHPAQIATCNEIFSPTAEELAWAEAVVAAFADPAHARAGVIRVSNEMVERLHLGIARRMLRLS